MSRLPALFQTVARNRQWWASGRLLSYGQRVSFQGSPLVWQYYTGEGLQIQWLGTFGKANALWKSRTHDADLRELLDDALALSAQRAGGIAFEYLFDFDGGRPPWASGMAQGTGIQALSRAAIRLGEGRYFDAARAALGIFRTAPPSGVRIATDRGAHYLIYSFAPGMRVLNGFTQAVNGLHDFALLANDAEGKRAVRRRRGAVARRAAGLRHGRVVALLAEHARPTSATTSSRATSSTTSARGCGRTPRGRRSGGRAARPRPAARCRSPRRASPPRRVADPALYCGAAQRWTSYLSQPPVVKLVTRRARAGKRGVAAPRALQALLRQARRRARRADVRRARRPSRQRPSRARLGAPARRQGL